MAKPEPTPALKAKQARDFAERLKKPRISQSAKELYRGAREQHRKSTSEE